jgi:hypothetical protein
LFLAIGIWTILSDKADWVSEAIQTRVQEAYNDLPTHLEAGQNPVIKNLLVIDSYGLWLTAEIASGIGDPQFALAVLPQKMRNSCNQTCNFSNP